MFSSDLIAICEQNLKKLGISAHLKACDVSKYELPDRDLVIFLFNPFGAERMAKLVKELIKRKNRYLVIYTNPKHSECFLSKPKHIDLKKHFGMYNELTYFYEI